MIFFGAIVSPLIALYAVRAYGFPRLESR